MGRLTSALRRARVDVRTCARTPSASRPASGYPSMRDAALAAREWGRSCYFRPLFDRPRHWAAQRMPRAAPLATK